MPASFEPESPEIFALLSASFDQISEALTEATKEKICSRKAQLLICMFERILDLTREAADKEQNRKNFRMQKNTIIKLDEAKKKLGDASKIVTSLLLKASRMKIDFVEVEELMKKLDEILQIIDDVNYLNGWKLKLNKKAM